MGIFRLSAKRIVGRDISIGAGIAPSVVLSAVAATVLCAVLAACSSSNGNGGGGGGSPSVTMQQGQWEFPVTQTSGTEPYFLEVNLTDSGGIVSSKVRDTAQLCSDGSQGVGFVVDARISGDILTGKIGNTALSATVAGDGASASEGTIGPGLRVCEAVFTSDTTGEGTLTGYPVAPLNGTFAGTLASDTAGPDLFTIAIAQDADFGITAAGTAVQDGVTTNISISPAGTPSDNTHGYSNVIGATLQANGVATNMNHRDTFLMIGRITPAGTQIAVSIFGTDIQTGTLTKQ